MKPTPLDKLKAAILAAIQKYESECTELAVTGINVTRLSYNSVDVGATDLTIIIASK